MTIPAPFRSPLPFSVQPFYSRIETQKDINNIKNYYGIAFNPGFPLQASELNEIQEIFYLQQTLTQDMISRWGGNEISTKNRDITNETTWNADKTAQIENSGWKLTSTGPGWQGCTPLDYGQITDTLLTDTNLINLKLSAGWYLVKSPLINGGFGVWVYQPLAIDIFGPPFNLNADIDSTVFDDYRNYVWKTLGLYVKSEVIRCSKTDSSSPGFDHTIQDFVNVNVINGPCGASRLNLQIDNPVLGIGRQNTGGLKEDTPEGYIFVPICKITTNAVDYRTGDSTLPRLLIAQYMNGTPISVKSE